MATHRLPPGFVSDPVHVVVVGCGGTGSSFAAGLPYLHQSLLAFGHPYGLHVTLVDGDTVSETNCVRQPFARSEVGHSKAMILATRMNLFWNLQWEAVHGFIGKVSPPDADLVVGCVDTRAARAAILKTYTGRGTRYWLDFGNSADAGQFVLGEFPRPSGRTTSRRFAAGDRTMDEAPRLPHVADLYPELVDPELDDDELPSCSAIEALTRQAPFVNQVLANHGLALLARLFRYGEVDFHGQFVNLATGQAVKIRAPEPAAPPAARPSKNGKKKRARTRARA